MTVARGPHGRHASSGLLGCWQRRPPLGFGAKVGIAIALGLSFAVVWTLLSWTSSSQQISTERFSFASDIAAPPPAAHNRTSGAGHAQRKPRPASHGHKKRHPSPSKSHSHRSNATASPGALAEKADQVEPAPVSEQEPKGQDQVQESEPEQEPDMEMEPEKEAELSVPDEKGDNGGKAPSEEEEDKAPELELEDEPNERDGEEEEDPEAAKRKAAAKKKRKLPPLFSSGAHYHWKQCRAKCGHHYVPCVDFDGDGSHKHHERSCPRSPVTCLVSLPKEYISPAPWPERKDKVSICA
jgi:hypothetical protein